MSDRLLTSLFFRHRGCILTIYFLIVFLFSHFQKSSFFLWGIPIIFFGLMIRFVASLYIVDTNTVKVGSTMLATQGIYAWIRNPLYLANILVGIGFLICISIENIWFLILMSFVLVLHHLLLIKIEEQFLLEQWGGGYVNYQREVPVKLMHFWIPKINWKPINWKPINWKPINWKPIISWKKALKYQYPNILKTLFLLLLLAFFRF